LARALRCHEYAATQHTRSQLPFSWSRTSQPSHCLGTNTSRNVKQSVEMYTRSTKRLSGDYSQALTALFAFMLNNGLQSKELLTVCTRALKKAESRARVASIAPSGGLATASLVLHAWHRDRRYLNSTASPKAVRLLGPPPSVEALIRVQKRRSDAVAIALHLKRLRLVVPYGRSLYKPTSDTAVISKHNPLIFQHAARAVSTLLETVTQNVSRGSSRSAPLIERTAEVPDLPRKHAAAFQRFSQRQGLLLLRTMNDWLESRRARRSASAETRALVRAGVHLYAYIAARDERSPKR
jgi:hypothetical protein